MLLIPKGTYNGWLNMYDRAIQNYPKLFERYIDDIICISKSGNTPEIKVLVPLIKASGNKIVAITGNKASFLGKNADFILNIYVIILFRSRLNN